MNEPVGIADPGGLDLFIGGIPMLDPRLASVLDALEDLVLLVAKDGTVLAFNKAMERMSGLKAGAVVGRECHEALSPEIAAFCLSECEAVFARGETVYSEEWLYTQQGGEFLLEKRSGPILDSNGEVQGLTMLARDLTAKHDEEAIRDARLALLEHAARHKSKEILTFAIERAQTLTGSSYGALLLVKPGTTLCEDMVWTASSGRAIPDLESMPMGFDVEDHGIVIECFRSRAPVLYNRPRRIYLRRGSDRRLSALRCLLVPIIRDGSVVAIFGLTDKPRPYASRDVAIVSSIADGMWDIAQRKLAEEGLTRALSEKELLLHELYHRTKNSMQIINAMLELEKENQSEQSVLRSFDSIQSKIIAIALVQETIYHAGDLSRLDLGEYLDRLVAELARNHQLCRKRIGIKARTVRAPISIDAAVPCGIIVSELVENALDHAFADQEQGQISISLRFEGEDMVLEVADSGCGLPDGFDPRRCKKIGFRTVIGIGEEQLGGRFEFESDKQGLVCRLRFQDTYYPKRL